ncbi:Transcription factor HFR1 [Cardamine amara subsp. amara]|uniref:Transcription factor HFR1 n=1 Tax=Cardamine amara subsp. amara TaxID=228776 RepID=A0ABD1BSZ1_CARAN
MEQGWRNDVESLALKDHGITEIATSDEDRLINGLKWSYGYFGHDQTHNDHQQIVPEIRKEEQVLKTADLLVLVPDEHSETGDYHHDYSDSSDNLCYLRNKHEKPKRRRVQILSDEESDGFTREVPSLTQKGSKRRRRDDELSNKMSTLQELLPNCHKADTVSVLDNAIEYMKNLKLQLQVMSAMGMNPYFPPATLNVGMHNYLLTAMALAHNQIPANQKTSSPLIPASNWPLPPFTNLSFPHSSYQSLFPTTPSPASSPQCLYGLVPCFPSFFDFSSHRMGRF